MSNYVFSNDFSIKGTSGDPIIHGVDFDVEFLAIQTASATKANINSPTFTGSVTIPTAALDDNSTLAASTAWAQNQDTFTEGVVQSLLNTGDAYYSSLTLASYTLNEVYHGRIPSDNTTATPTIDFGAGAWPIKVQDKANLIYQYDPGVLRLKAGLTYSFRYIVDPVLGGSNYIFALEDVNPDFQFHNRRLLLNSLSASDAGIDSSVNYSSILFQDMFNISGGDSTSKVSMLNQNAYWNSSFWAFRIANPAVRQAFSSVSGTDKYYVSVSTATPVVGADIAEDRVLTISPYNAVTLGHSTTPFRGGARAFDMGECQFAIEVDGGNGVYLGKNAFWDGAWKGHNAGWKSCAINFPSDGSIDFLQNLGSVPATTDAVMTMTQTLTIHPTGGVGVGNTTTDLGTGGLYLEGTLSAGPAGITVRSAGSGSIGGSLSLMDPTTNNLLSFLNLNTNLQITNTSWTSAQYDFSNAGLVANFADISTFVGNISSGGTLTAAGATTLSSTLTVSGTGATSLGGSLTVTGATVLNSTLTVSGTGATTLGGSLTVTGATVHNGPLTVSGTNSTTLGGSLNVTGGTHANSTMYVTGGIKKQTGEFLSGVATLDTYAVSNVVVSGGAVQAADATHTRFITAPVTNPGNATYQALVETSNGGGAYAVAVRDINSVGHAVLSFFVPPGRRWVLSHGSIYVYITQ